MTKETDSTQTKVTQNERFYQDEQGQWRCEACGGSDIVDQGIPELGPVGLRCLALGCGAEDIRPFTPEEREGLSEAGEDAPEDWLD